MKKDNMKYLIIILLFASCNATKQAAKHFSKGIAKDRVYFAKATRDTFPCNELFKTDTAIYVYDSLIYVECPQDYHIGDTNTSVPKDGKNDIKKIVETATVKGLTRVPVTIPIRTRFITKYFEDSAKIVIAQKETATANEQIKKQDRIIERRGNLNMHLIIALLLSLLINFIQFKRK